MTPWLDDGDVRLYHGDALTVLADLPDGSVDCVVTSPPYWGLRDYGTGQWDGGDPDCDHRVREDARIESSTLGGGKSTTGHQREGFKESCPRCGATRIDQQLGLEPTPDLFVANMVAVFREIRRVLADHGTCWVNLGSSYYGAGYSNHKNTGGATRAQGGKQKHSYASGDTRPSQSHPDALAYDSDDTERAGSQETDSAYRDLCDECLADYLNHRGRTAGTNQPLSLDAQPPAQTARDTEQTGSVSTSPDASLPAAQASTTLQSWLRLRGECSRCDTRASSLSVVRSSASDAPGFSHSSWLNYTSRLKPKDMVPTPWMVAMALQEDGWYLRADIIWSKANPMPESVTDRPTKSHEYVFLLTKQPRYWFDAEAVREPAEWARWGAQNGAGKYAGENSGAAMIQSRTKMELQKKAEGSGRNVRTVWNIATQPYPEAHFATFPEELARRCILAGCPTRVCRVCGKPSERILERQPTGFDGSKYGERAVAATGGAKTGGTAASTLGSGGGKLTADYETVGWSDCGHNNWRPGVTLDPFIGSGTVAKVARDHQRHAIGIDLNEQYLELAARRLQQLSLLTV